MILRLIFPALIAAATVAAAGCAAPQPPAPAPEQAGRDPQHGGTFYLAARNGVALLDPFKENTPGGAQNTWMAYENLVEYDYSQGDYRERYKIVPKLAESWETVNSSTYLFHLRKGVKFHDGSDFTADDVVWTLEYLRNPANNFPKSAYIREATTIEAVDPNTVKIGTRGANRPSSTT